MAVAKSLAQSWWAVAVISLLTAAVLYQRWQVTHPTRPQVLIVGERLRPVRLETLDARPIRIDWGADGRPTVLYAFRPGCAWCKRNLAAVQALAEGIASQYRVVGVSLTRDGLREYLNQSPFRFPVYVAGPEARQLKLGGTPETLVISSDGVVMNAWLGAYVAKTSDDVERKFQIKLPRVRLE